MKILQLIIIIIIVTIIICFIHNLLVTYKLNNLSRRIEYTSLQQQHKFCEFTKTVNQSLQYLDDCNTTINNLLNTTLNSIQQLLSNMEIDKNSILYYLKNDLSLLNTSNLTQDNITQLYDQLNQIQIKYKSLDISDNVLYDSIIKCNKLISFVLLNKDINLLKSDYLSQKQQPYALQQKGDVNIPSIFNSRRILLLNETLYMPNTENYNTFDIIYIDATPQSTISNIRTSMLTDFVITENTTVIFTLYEDKWKLINTVNM